MTTMIDDRLLERLLPKTKYKLEKFHGDSTDPKDLYEVIEGDWNLLMYGGASVQWQTLIGNGTTTANNTNTYFDSTRAALGAGNSSTAAAATQTNLQGTTNVTDRIRKAATATHSAGTAVGNASIVFVATFSTTEANFTWNEWGVFNTTTDASGTMLSRKVENLGTKTSAATWQLTVTLTLA